tara:strand:- start:1421 stop:2458 length:1038 start_codon:yes stop_codon:yes gene_type:complete
MAAQPGALRFNTDSMKLEIFRGSQWEEIQATSPDVETGGTRAVLVGGIDGTGNADSFIDFININTNGNAQDFGATYQIQSPFSFSSRTRGIIAGGAPANGSGNEVSDIKFITIASLGNITTFGDIGRDTYSNSSGCSNETRGLIAGGSGDGAFSPVNRIDYVTISSTGNAEEFGDIQDSKNRVQHADFGNSTRAIFAGGYYTTGSGGTSNSITCTQYATLGNTTNFGACTQSENIRMGGASNAIRGIFGGGQPRNSNSLDSITIPTLGAAIDWGDLTSGGSFVTAASSPTRCVFTGRSDSGGSGYAGSNIIDYVQFASKGNAIDFGNLTNGRARMGTFSNGHGGL